MARERPRVLIVDDVDDNVFTLRRRLGQFLDADIDAAENGRVALDRLAEARFDLVLLDVQMPELDGLAVLERMTTDMALRDIPVIMVSAVDDFDTVLRCIKLGAHDYVPKPFNAELLRARVESALDRKRLRDQQQRFVDQLRQEKATVDDLLHSLLPSPVAAELKASGRPRPRRHDGVAVLFCDIVGFTEYCERHPAEHVVEQLENLFAGFEACAEAHGLEKIKTIGDAFMATAGLLAHVDDAALAVAECGLAMVEEAGRHGEGWRVRVGAHVGPVVAGVMGRRHIAYDLWGDTVNTAARVVAEAEPGSVVVTAETWPFLAPSARGRSLGLIDLKGKGPTELVRYLGRK